MHSPCVRVDGCGPPLARCMGASHRGAFYAQGSSASNLPSPWLGAIGVCPEGCVMSQLSKMKHSREGVLAKRGQLTRPSFGVLRTFGASRVPGSLPVAEVPRYPQAQSLALGMCQLLPQS